MTRADTSLRIALAAALFSTIACAQSKGPEWPRWRGPLDSGVAVGADPPVSWSEEENVRWKAPIPGLGHSTPVVAGDRIVLTTAIPTGEALPPKPDLAPGAHDNAPVTHRQELVVIAYAREDGEVIWRRKVGEVLPHEGGHVTGSHASASPVTDGEHVWAFFGSHGLFCLDLAGGVPVWGKELGRLATKHGHGEASSPTLHGDAVIVNQDHEGQSFLVSLDKLTGEVNWRVERDEPTSWATPIVVEVGGKPVLVVSGTGRLRGYDLAKGEVLWECGGLTANIVASPVAGDGMLFAASSYGKQAMIALRLEGAEGDLTTSENVVWTRRRRTPYIPSPLLYDGWIYVLHHYQGVMSRIDARTGAEPKGPFRLAGVGSLYASPIAAAGRLYFVDLEGSTAVLSAEAEPQLLALNRLDDRFNASPVAVGDELFLRGETYLYCLASE